MPVPRIHRLSPAVFNQIAAGEVIERPASVVKELLENALDASADKITVQLQQAGTNLIRVIDNGHGIHQDDMPLVLESHSTSKLSSSSDLNAINSFGFRGEALASIASIAELTLSSSADDSKQGQSVQYPSDRSIDIEPCARTRGTTIEVKNLFFNTPARKKFLRSNNTEYQHILSVFKAIALCHFNVAFTLEHNEKITLNLAQATEDYGKRVRDICGADFINNATAFDFTHEQMRLWGWLGNAETARNQTDKQYLYINQRFVRDKHIQHAIRLAYQDRLYPGRHPCYVIFLELQPALFDVNVHPGKQEVRFQQPRDIHDFVFHCLNQVLSGEQLGEFQIVSNELVLPVSADEKTMVEEPIVEYFKVQEQGQDQGIKSKSSLSQCNVLNNRYCVYQVEEGLLLIDIHRARELFIKESLSFQYQRNKQISSRPLLIPFEYQNHCAKIDRLAAIKTTMAALGFHYTRSTPDHLMVRELPESVHYIDIRLFLDSLVDTVSEMDPVTHFDQLIDLIARHSNDQLPELLSPEESRQLMVFCYKRKPFSDDKSRLVYRLLDVESIAALLQAGR